MKTFDLPDLGEGLQEAEIVSWHVAAGDQVVADQPLVNYVPLQKATRGDSVMTQYDMKVLDKIGLLKMDFLGLANLTMLAKSIENVRQVRGLEIDLNRLDLTD